VLRIHYRNGNVLQGILLALGDQRIRVALKGSDDVAEYRLVNQHWVSEDCEIVSLAFGEAASPLQHEEFPDTMVASGFDRPVATRIM
jgi:hypothetical protein